MEFRQLLDIVGEEPLFETALLLAGDVDPDNVRQQLSRWAAADKLYRLRRGLYALAPPYQKVKPHPFLVANHLLRASYVSLHAALAHYGLIPEHVPVVTSVTTARPGRWETPLGRYEFRHIKTALLYGYRLLDLGRDQQAFVATPEKALLDLVYLQPAGDTPAYLQGLRLQNLDRLDVTVLRQMAERAGSPKLRRAAASIGAMAAREADEYEILADRPG
jgi:predicted transcriptional regulator of viral defense system